MKSFASALHAHKVRLVRSQRLRGISPASSLGDSPMPAEEPGEPEALAMGGVVDGEGDEDDGGGDVSGASTAHILPRPDGISEEEKVTGDFHQALRRRKARYHAY